MTTLNPYCCVISLKYASPSILAPFSGLTLVFIIVLSECTIGETPTSNQVVAATLIVLGQILIALFGDHTNVAVMGIMEVQQEYSDPGFIMYIIAMVGWILVLASYILFGRSNDSRFAWGVIGGSVTGIQPFLKDALAVLSGLQRRNVPIADYPLGLFVLLVLAGVIPLLGLALLMQCMKRYDASYTSSMFVGSMIVSVSVMSAVRYNTFDNLEGIWNAIMYVLGLCVLSSGCAVLACEDSYKGELHVVKICGGDAKKTQIHVSRSPSDVTCTTYGTLELAEGEMSSDSSLSSDAAVNV